MHRTDNPAPVKAVRDCVDGARPPTEQDARFGDTARSSERYPTLAVHESLTRRPANPMKAAWRDDYGGPDVVSVREIAKPTPAEGQVVVRVKAASVNRGDLDALYPQWQF